MRPLSASHPGLLQLRITMATPNYSFEKRKRELAKKAAKEAKKLRKIEQAATAETSTVVEEPAADAARVPLGTAVEA